MSSETKRVLVLFAALTAGALILLGIGVWTYYAFGNGELANHAVDPGAKLF